MAVKQTGQPSFMEALLPKGAGSNAGLDRLAGLVKWYRFEKLLAHLRDEEGPGRPGYPVLVLFRALLLQSLYGLSDRELEEALGDRLSFKRFAGLSLEDATPDHTVLNRFRNQLVEQNLLAKLFAELDRQLESAGLILKRGTMLDATLIQAVSAPPKEDRPSNDPDARFAKRQGKSGSTFGYKAHVGVDEGSGLIRAVLTTRPSGRMPKLLTTAEEAKSVASYLLQGARLTAPVGRGSSIYTYHEGSWDKVPDFSKLKPVASGTITGFDLGIARRNQDYAVQFTAYLKIEREATYTFSLMSDDGSVLAIDGKTVVNNDGVHSPQTKTGRAKLTKGIHKVTVGFFQVGGGAELDVRIAAPGFGQHNLGDLIAPSAEGFSKKPKPKATDPDAIDIQPALVEKGKALFASLGCASCHAMHDDKKPIATKVTGPALAKLKKDGGCLSASPSKGLPVYGLDDHQRKAIATAIKAPTPAKSSAETIATTFTTFNCYACHVRDKVGGPEEAINKLFTTAQPEMGDEGRVPPPLDGVGAKLTTEYFKQILDKGAHDRPYMHTRMPGFGLGNVGHLVETLASVDKLPPMGDVKFKEPITKVKAIARHLVGGGALACIKCHTFAGHRAEGVQGIDMVLLPKRLRRDWFHAYIRDPQRVRPGTRMPASFIEGKSVLPGILDGTAGQQIEAMWVYLSAGNPQLPVGMGKASIVLEPTTGAILYRNFIAGAGSRAIAVGYPERAHLAFDANEMRLALLWQGAFIDAARHWTNRGEGYEGPLGDNIVTLHHGAPFAVLAKPDEAWPTAAPKTLGYRFRGYKLSSDDRPTFNYSFGEVKVEDFPNAVVAGKDVLVRRALSFTAGKAPDNLTFRAAVGNKIVELEDGWYRIDDTWKIKVPKEMKARIRKSAGKMELLVPVPFVNGKAELVCDYAW